MTTTEKGLSPAALHPIDDDAAAEREWEVRKTVYVPVTPAEAFDVFVSRPTEWYPAHHALLAKREQVVFEPRVGGRWYEWSTDGEVRDWGRVLKWEPGRRLALTWRIDGRWQAIDDDTRASEIEVSFEPVGADGCLVELAHVKMWRHRNDAELIRAAVSGPSPGDTLARFEATVRKHLPGRPAPATTPDELKQVARDAFAAMADGAFDLRLAAELHTPGYLDHEALPGGESGPAGVVAHMAWLRSVYPDLHFEFQDLIAEADKVVIRCVFTGTHLGELFGLAPTGRPVTVDQIHILRFEDGRIAEHWAGRDHRGLMKQLGQA